MQSLVQVRLFPYAGAGAWVKVKIAVLVPVTNLTYLPQMLTSLRQQVAFPDELILLSNGLANTEHSRLLRAVESHLRPDHRPNVQVIRSQERLLTSAACAQLLEQSQADYAALLADDDLLPSDYISTAKRLVVGRADTHVLKFPLASFSEESPSPPQEFQLSLGYQGHRLSMLTTLLAGFTGLLSGGGTVFPIPLAKREKVFDSPIPVLLEDQLLSTRLLRTGIPLVCAADTAYLYRIHANQRRPDDDHLAYDAGVVRALRVAEEQVPYRRWINVAGTVLDLRTFDNGALPTYYAGFLRAGGHRHHMRTALILRTLAYLVSLRSRIRRRFDQGLACGGPQLEVRLTSLSRLNAASSDLSRMPWAETDTDA